MVHAGPSGESWSRALGRCALPGRSSGVPGGVAEAGRAVMGDLMRFRAPTGDALTARFGAGTPGSLSTVFKYGCLPSTRGDSSPDPTVPSDPAAGLVSRPKARRTLPMTGVTMRSTSLRSFLSCGRSTYSSTSISPVYSITRGRAGLVLFTLDGGLGESINIRVGYTGLGGGSAGGGEGVATMA